MTSSFSTSQSETRFPSGTGWSARSFGNSVEETPGQTLNERKCLLAGMCHDEDRKEKSSF